MAPQMKKTPRRPATSRSSRAKPRLTLGLGGHGGVISPVSISASDAKNEFARALETALRDGYVVITKHDQPKAVLVSFDEFESLTRQRNPRLEALSAKFDQLFERLQSPHARSVIQSVFESSPEELGRAAVEAVRRRRSSVA
jgi:antitoxin Phd